MTETRLDELLLAEGISVSDCSLLSTVEKLQYLKYHHKKHWGKSYILFMGFDENEVKKLVELCDNKQLAIRKQLTKDLNFVCIGPLAEGKRIEKAKLYCTSIITERELYEIFSPGHYTLKANPKVFNRQVEASLQIAIPLNNFNETLSLESFSDASEDIYTVNLYNRTCTCNEFRSKKAEKYLLGDVRGLCKHLITTYKNRFGPCGLSAFSAFVVSTGYGLKKYLKEINIPGTGAKVWVSYNHVQDWWDLYFVDEAGVYAKYGYEAKAQEFSYNDKPIGYVKALRTELNKLYRSQNNVSLAKWQMTRSYTEKANLEHHLDKPLSPAGLAIGIAVVVVIIYFILH